MSDAVQPGTGNFSSEELETANGGYNDGTCVDEDVPPVQVCIRMRPLLEWERADNLESCAMELREGRPGSVALRREDKSFDWNEYGLGSRAKDSISRNFMFNAVFGPESSQQDLWEQLNLAHLVGKVIDGFNTTVLAYGQTGSGKTYTMEGFEYDKQERGAQGAPSVEARKPRARVHDTPEERFGIVPRMLHELFARIEQYRDEIGARDSFSVKISYLQVYMERIYDLLSSSALPADNASGRGDDTADLKLRWNSAHGRFCVENLFEYECTSVKDALDHYMRGARRKTMAATAMNAASSRSHAVLQLTLVRRTELESSNELSSSHKSHAGHHAPYREVVSSLVLVDLAGSERSSATSNDGGTKTGGDRFKEAVNINQSLFALRRVITALSSRAQGREESEHVPYRDSKLTSLLQHVIGGNSYMLMLACLSPADKHVEENLSTLQYASQAALIKAEPIVNLDPKDQLIQSLRQQLQDAKEQLKEAHEYILSRLQLEELPPELSHHATTHMAETKGVFSGPGIPKKTSGSFRSTRPGGTRISQERVPLRERADVEINACNAGFAPVSSSAEFLRCSAPASLDEHSAASGAARPPQLPCIAPSHQPAPARDCRDSPGQTRRSPIVRSISEQQLPMLACVRGGSPALTRHPGATDVLTEVRAASAHVPGSAVSGGLPGMGRAASADAMTDASSSAPSHARSSSVGRTKPRRSSAPVSREQQIMRDLAVLRQKQAALAALRERQEKVEEENRLAAQREKQAKLEEKRQSRSHSRPPAPVDDRAEPDLIEPEPGDPGRFEWVQKRCFDMRSRFDQLTRKEMRQLEALLDEFASLAAELG